MNTYEFAIQMEHDGEKYYRELAGKCRVEGLRTILTMLAEEEVEHYKAIVQLQKRVGNSLPAKTAVLKNVKNIFVAMREVKTDIRFNSSELAAYQKVMDIEEMSRKFYMDTASEIYDAGEKTTLLRLADEEEKHCRVMENIVDFVARPEPGAWLENAEWHHLDEY